eukprot:TRINITY_DN20100_c0_g1_i1.p1 TRINITY_DN20100_c0_g1~~TRINITY_DN20100_c0_g1_i1.p1  ORF type:complete len:1533 (+),score=405.97 TRINITY_DN20100_c0_g1_i1:54-4652(+)
MIQGKAKFSEAPTRGKPKPSEVFPNSLGPFAVESLGDCLPTVTDDGKWVLPLPPYCVGIRATEIDDCGRPAVGGTIAPPSAITLSGSARNRARIPPLATRFAWAYPAQPLPLDTPADQLSGPEKTIAQFCLFGGYLYLTQDGQTVGANGVVGQGDHLCFDRAYPWQDDDATEIMTKGRRWQRVTADHLQKKGARFFCWMRPGESVGRIPALKHGGFAYLFREPDSAPHKLDRYFPVREVRTSKASLSTGWSLAELLEDQDYDAQSLETQSNGGLFPDVNGRKKAGTADGRKPVSSDELIASLPPLLGKDAWLRSAKESSPTRTDRSQSPTSDAHGVRGGYHGRGVATPPQSPQDERGGREVKKRVAKTRVTFAHLVRMSADLDEPAMIEFWHKAHKRQRGHWTCENRLQLMAKEAGVEDDEASLKRWMNEWRRLMEGLDASAELLCVLAGMPAVKIASGRAFQRLERERKEAEELERIQKRSKKPPPDEAGEAPPTLANKIRQRISFHQPVHALLNVVDTLEPLTEKETQWYTMGLKAATDGQATLADKWSTVASGMQAVPRVSARAQRRRTQAAAACPPMLRGAVCDADALRRGLLRNGCCDGNAARIAAERAARFCEYCCLAYRDKRDGVADSLDLKKSGNADADNLATTVASAVRRGSLAHTKLLHVKHLWKRGGALLSELLQNLRAPPEAGAGRRIQLLDILCQDTQKRFDCKVKYPGYPPLLVALMRLYSLEGPDIDRVLGYEDAVPPASELQQMGQEELRPLYRRYSGLGLDPGEQVTWLQVWRAYRAQFEEERNKSLYLRTNRASRVCYDAHVPFNEASEGDLIVMSSASKPEEGRRLCIVVRKDPTVARVRWMADNSVTRESKEWWEGKAWPLEAGVTLPVRASTDLSAVGVQLSGLTVAGVQPGSLAADLGAQPGWVVSRIDATAVGGAAELNEEIRRRVAEGFGYSLTLLNTFGGQDPVADLRRWICYSMALSAAAFVEPLSAALPRFSNKKRAGDPEWWRGIGGLPSDRMHEIRARGDVFTSSNLSISTCKQAAASFLGGPTSSTVSNLLIHGLATGGRGIVMSGVSAYPAEEEVLVPLMTSFAVKNAAGGEDLIDDRKRAHPMDVVPLGATLNTRVAPDGSSYVKEGGQVDESVPPFFEELLQDIEAADELLQMIAAELRMKFVVALHSEGADPINIGLPRGLSCNDFVNNILPRPPADCRWEVYLCHATSGHFRRLPVSGDSTTLSEIAKVGDTSLFAALQHPTGIPRRLRLVLLDTEQVTWRSPLDGVLPPEGFPETSESRSFTTSGGDTVFRLRAQLCSALDATPERLRAWFVPAGCRTPGVPLAAHDDPASWETTVLQMTEGHSAVYCSVAAPDEPAFAGPGIIWLKCYDPIADPHLWIVGHLAVDPTSATLRDVAEHVNAHLRTKDAEDVKKGLPQRYTNRRSGHPLAAWEEIDGVLDPLGNAAAIQDTLAEQRLRSGCVLVLQAASDESVRWLLRQSDKEYPGREPPPGWLAQVKHPSAPDFYRASGRRGSSPA